MEEVLGEYEARNLPVVSMALLLKVNYFPSKGFLFIAPHCNVRYVSTSRISSMDEKLSESDKSSSTFQFSNNSSSTILLCEETTNSSINVTKGDCLIFKNDDDDNSEFSFKIQKKSLFPLYCLSIKDTPEIKDEETFQTHYDHFEKVHGGSKHIPATFFSIFTAVVGKYKLGEEYLNGYEKIYNDMSKLEYLKSQSDFEDKELPDVASMTLKAVFRFQQICPLRMTILEGNHRHVFFLSKALHLSVKESSKEGNYKAFFEIDTPETQSISLLPVQFIYSVYVAEDKLSTQDIVKRAIQLSRNSTEQHRQAVDEEEVHM